MIVRDAKPDDLDALQRIGRDFTKAAGLSNVDPESLNATLVTLMNDGILKVADNGSVVGVAGALVFPHYWNAKELIAQELFWWVDADHRGTSAGVKLLISLEQSAREKGARKLMMLCLEAVEPDRVSRIYEKLGYVPLERAFVKELV